MIEFIKLASGTPELKVADVEYNVEKIKELICKASEEKVKLLVLQELCITWYITTQQLKDLEDLDYKFGEPFETTIGGNKYLACKVELTDNSMTQIYYIRKVENHMLAIIVTANNASDVAEDLIADFN